ncbi:jg24438, partial [Pararge aegeria aegeria]
VSGREPTEVCHECGCAADTAQRTLAECPKRAESRKALVATVWHDLSLPAVVRAKVGSDRTWEEMVCFCEDVMVQKELAKRLKEHDVDSNPLRRRRVCPLKKDLRAVDTRILSPVGVKASS